MWKCEDEEMRRCREREGERMTILELILLIQLRSFRAVKIIDIPIHP